MLASNSTAATTQTLCVKKKLRRHLVFYFFEYPFMSLLLTGCYHMQKKNKRRKNRKRSNHHQRFLIIWFLCVAYPRSTKTYPTQHPFAVKFFSPFLCKTIKLDLEKVNALICLIFAIIYKSVFVDVLYTKGGWDGVEFEGRGGHLAAVQCCRSPREYRASCKGMKETKGIG